MNISSINCNVNTINIRRNNKVSNKTVSFQGKAKFAENAGCLKDGLLPALLLVAISPILLILGLISHLLSNKKDKISETVEYISGTYRADYGASFNDIFDQEVKELNQLLDKHAKNDNYTQFVKEAIGFLSAYMAKYPNCQDRLKPFQNVDKWDTLPVEFVIFSQTIKDSAKAAISKDLKNIDTERLDKNIQKARELMQRAKQQQMD